MEGKIVGGEISSFLSEPTISQEMLLLPFFYFLLGSHPSN